MKRWLSVIPMLVVAGSCYNGIGVPDEDFRVTAAENGLELFNDTEVDLFYQAINPESFALWAGPSATTDCVEPACPHVAPGQTTVVPWSEIIGWGETTTRVTVYWWRVASDGQGGWQMDGTDLESREVLLP